MNLSKEQVLGIARHTLTFIGGIVVMKGWADDAMVTEIIGGILTLVGGIWSVVTKAKA
jgi:hypothetical protein